MFLLKKLKESPLPSPTFSVLAVFLVLLPVFGFVQLTWLNRLRDADLKQMNQGLDAAVSTFRDQFDRDLADMRSHFKVESARGERAARQLALKHRTWQERFSHPKLIDQIYWINHEQGNPVVHRFNPEQGQLEATSWPTSLAQFRSTFRKMAYHVSFALSDPIPLLHEKTRCLVIPYHGERPYTGLGSWVVLELDDTFLKQNYIPNLMSDLFFRGDHQVLKIGIVSVNNPNRLIYRSQPDLSLADLREPDRAVAFFGQPDTQAQPAFLNRGASRDEATGGEWLLLVKHQAGSLRAAANGIRNRNLAMSYAVLFILGAALVLSLGAHWRSKDLLRRQMAYFSGISHDLRTPLAVINSAGYNLSRNLVDDQERVRCYGALIEKESIRLKRMVNEVLEVSRAQTSPESYRLEPLDVQAVIETVIQSNSGLLESRDFAMQHTIDEDLPLILGNEAALQSALENLITNGVKYGERGRWLKLSARVAKRKNQILIQVQDGGTGMTAADVKHIFDPFFRTEQARSSGLEGSGLGLSLVKQVMAVHGGSVEVTSVVQQGSTFNLRLPIPSDRVLENYESGGLQTWKRKFSLSKTMWV